MNTLASCYKLVVLIWRLSNPVYLFANAMLVSSVKFCEVTNFASPLTWLFTLICALSHRFGLLMIDYEKEIIILICSHAPSHLSKKCNRDFMEDLIPSKGCV